MQVGDMVHVLWRGRCHAAIITEFWEDEDTCRLTVFEQSSMSFRPRAERGGVGDDQKWHPMSEAHDDDDVPVEEEDGGADTEGEPGATAVKAPTKARRRRTKAT